MQPGLASVSSCALQKQTGTAHHPAHELQEQSTDWQLQGPQHPQMHPHWQRLRPTQLRRLPACCPAAPRAPLPLGLCAARQVSHTSMHPAACSSRCTVVAWPQRPRLQASRRETAASPVPGGWLQPSTSCTSPCLQPVLTCTSSTAAALPPPHSARTRSIAGCSGSGKSVASPKDGSPLHGRLSASC